MASPGRGNTTQRRVAVILDRKCASPELLYQTDQTRSLTPGCLYVDPWLGRACEGGWRRLYLDGCPGPARRGDGQQGDSEKPPGTLEFVDGDDDAD